MSPQYTHQSAPYHHHSNCRSASSKIRNMFAGEDPLYRALDRALARAYIQQLQQRHQQRRPGTYLPRMDICDDPSRPYITAILELPGMHSDQLSTRVENGVFIVEGQRPGPRMHARPQSEDDAAEPTPSTLYPVQEIKYGRFRRQWPLPEGVTEEDVRSSLQNGMLTVTWPRNRRTHAARSVSAEPPAAQTDTGGRGSHEANSA